MKHFSKWCDVIDLPCRRNLVLTSGIWSVQNIVTTNTVEHIKDFQYIRLIFKDFLNSWFHYKFVFKLSLRIFHQLHNRRWNYSAVGYTCFSKRLFVYHLKRSKTLLARILFVMRQNLIFSLIVTIHVIFKSLGFETVISIKKLDTAPSPLLWLIFPIWFILDE